MPAQITVRIPDELRASLDQEARLRGRRPSEIVRLALMQYLSVDHSDVARADRVSDLLGSLESGVPDLASRHRQYVLESLRRGS